MSEERAISAKNRTRVEELGLGELMTRVDALRIGGHRLVQILAVAGAEAVELNYSFGLEHEMIVLRLRVAPGTTVPSITPVYAAAFLYENEIRDLFGVAIERILLDWLGKVYDVASDKPFSKVKLTMKSSEEANR